MRNSIVALFALVCLVVFGVGCSSLKIRAATQAEVEWMQIEQASYVFNEYSKSRNSYLKGQWRLRWGYPSLYAYQQALANGELDETKGASPNLDVPTPNAPASDPQSVPVWLRK